ncbi:penicillin-binding protein 1C [Ottowia sp.]|uniref:penicillin-binding protein 1C n=1 Tax=Ottowia sp. TaxID=1898956 RepID=UPI002D07FFDB|nr:penicillin-binding protein 1C [Ottowia sp.]HRN74791.1 penicillin-binding protein 1C [Ottowia sp.]HRQ01943.1 penicillin-binding protein 1C [Ottowia sp.]
MNSNLRRTLLALAIGCGVATSALAVGFEQVRDDFHPSETLLLDRHGEPIHRLRSNATVRRGEWVDLQRISPALRQALVLSEDKRFHEHSGVDWQAVTAAAWANLWNTRTRGASTLTMQLAGLLDEDLRLGSGGRTLRQKIGQAVMATRLERSWRKDQILEAYLNLVPFRGELVGIDALSRTLFAKAPHGLQDGEAAIAAALVRAPNARPALVAQRACGVLKAMRGEGAVTDCVALDMQAEVVLARRAWQPSEGIAPHLARRLLAQARADAAEPPATLRSTLDAGLQRLALNTLQQHLRELHGRNVEDGAVVVLDNASGEVLAWVGSSGTLSQAAEVDGVLAPRQPGSTLKPFLYAQAIAERRLTAASLLDDSPAHLKTASGLYIPQNYDRRFKGWVSARTALAASLNVPAVRALVMVSPDAFARQLQALGIGLREGGGYYGYSLALGSPEVPLLQLTNAYRALANGGRLCEVRLQAPLPPPLGTGQGRGQASNCAQILDPAAAFIVTDIMADRNARAPTFGTDSILATRFWSAVKTGTSKDMRDNWAVGFSERYTVGVWIGNAGGAPMWDVSGTSGAAPVWAALMRHLHARMPSRAPGPPAGLIEAPVRFGDGLEAARREWFLPGTEQTLFAVDGDAPRTLTASGATGEGLQPTASAVPARITTPQDGTILALDPDIPPARQRLSLRADTGGAASASLHWWIGAREIGRGEQAQWLPWPGRHLVQLRDVQGRVHDERHIEVRGAAAR